MNTPSASSCLGVASDVVGVDGKFILSFLPPGSYELRMTSSRGYASLGSVIVLGAGEVKIWVAYHLSGANN